MSQLYAKYAASVDLAVTIASLASSSSFVTGVESDAYDNTSLTYLDGILGGKISTGTSPTAGEIRIYVGALLNDTLWPDVLDGSNSAETFTTAAIQDMAVRLAARMITSSSSNITYPFGPISIASLFGLPALPKKIVVFVAHNTVAALHATAGNHVVSVTGVSLEWR